MAYETVCNKCQALVTVLDDETGREEGHAAPCIETTTEPAKEPE